MSQLQIDSAVNARVDSIRADMMMRNDSMINAMAMQKADSMLMARGSEAAGTTVGKNTMYLKSQNINQPEFGSFPNIK